MIHPQPSPLPLVHLENVHLRLGGLTIFAGLSLDIMPGEHLAVLGPNGAGKSSLLRLIQGELRPMQDNPGCIYWGLNGQKDCSVLAAREHVRLVSPREQQNYFRRGWNITGEEIILAGLDNAIMVYGEVAEQHYQAVQELAEAADASNLLSMPGPTMSQGQMRMTLLLRALVAKPALLLLDEPFDALDSAARSRFHKTLDIAAERGSTIVLTSHRDQDTPGFIRRRVALSAPATAQSGGAVISGDSGTAGTAKATGIFSGVPASPAFSTMEEDEAEGLPSKAPYTALVDECRQKNLPILELVDVDCYIDRKLILSDIHWRINPGEQWIVSGKNGSGKSTLLRLLYGEEFAAFKGEYSGIVRWFGKPRPTLEEFRKLVGYVSDRLQESYDHDIPSEQVIVSGLRASVGIYDTPGEEELAVAGLWMAAMGLSRMATVPFTHLSTGWARRFLLARALAASPPVLLLDEPCSGLDANSRKQFLNGLELLAGQGVHIVHVSHNESDAGSLFTHELRLKKGRVEYAGRRM